MKVPSVTIQTIDDTQYIPYFTNEIACFCGSFEQGPVNTPTFITSVNDLIDIFGKPKIGTAVGYSKDWYQVFNYLQYSSGIYVSRLSQDPATANCLIIEDSTFSAYIKNSYEGMPINNLVEFNDLEYQGLTIFAKTPGLWGNELSVAIIRKEQWDNNEILLGNLRARDVFQYFDNDFLGLVVFKDGIFVERFYERNFDTVSQFSEYIYLNDTINRDINVLNNLSYYGSDIIELEYGFDIFADGNDIDEGYMAYGNKDEFDIDIIIGNDLKNQSAIDLAEFRKDCIAFIGLPIAIVDYLATETDINAILTPDYYPIAAVTRSKFSKNVNQQQIEDIFRYIDETVTKSQYACFTINIKEQYDRFNGKNMNINIAADIAGLKAQASKNSPWITGAGLERGIIKNATDILVQLDYPEIVYDRGINFVRGGALMSQRTFITEETSFNRVNVRSLFNHVEKECTKLLRYYVFEFNDRQMRGRIASTIKQYLQTVKAARGIDAGKVIVTGDKNEVKIDVYIKPTYVAEFIQMRITNTGRDSVIQYLTGNL